MMNLNLLNVTIASSGFRNDASGLSIFNIKLNNVCGLYTVKEHGSF